MNSKLVFLLERVRQSTASEQEYRELLQLIRSDESGTIVQDIHNFYHLDPGASEPYGIEEMDVLFASVLKAQHDSIEENNNTPSYTTYPIHRVHLLKTAWFRSAAAAILILIIGLGAFFWKTQKHISPVAQTNPAAMQNNVAAPTTNRATLTLAGGRQIFIDSAMNGTLAIQGDVNIQKMDDGQIVYVGKGEPGQMQYNILTVPRGSQIASIVLSDGTKVFLNASSSLTYPVAFSDNERRVEITGEAYFEVTKDPRRKFIVKSGNSLTEVLGTHFNVNSYPDEENMKITLLEGSVKVVTGLNQEIIKPGDQAAFTKGTIQVNKSVDIAQVMAWKNGSFNFSNADLPAVMRQISRWYDVEVTYEGPLAARAFNGEISRDISLSDLLDGLSRMNLHFRIDRKKLIVKP